MSDPRAPRRLFRIAPTRRSVEREIDDEMRFHLQTRIDELVRRGVAPDEAQRTATREFGDVTAARAELASIDRRRLGRVALREWLASLAQDLRFASRGLRARPGFTLTVLITLALGIGANAAIFSVVDAVLVRQLPYARPDRLVHLQETFRSKQGSSEASYPDFLDWRAGSRVFAALGGYQSSRFLVGAVHPVAVNGTKVTANFFDVLGVRAAHGRTFAAGEDAVGAPKVAMLAWGFWQRQFGADPAVVGRTITVDGAPATVVGVLPPEFRFRDASSDYWTPIDRPADTREQRGNHWLNVIGRLRDGQTIGAARQEMTAIMRELERQYPVSNANRTATVVPLRDELIGSARPLILLLYGAAAVMLLVACSNVANLLLMRGADRSREIALRVALGAGRARLVRQLLTESVLLAVLGGAAGLIVARAALGGLLRAMPPARLSVIPGLSAASIDAGVIAYAFAVSLVAAIAFGLIPALRATAGALNDTLRQGGRGATRGSGALRDGLVIAEIGLTVILVSGAALFGRSLLALMAVQPGFRVDHLTTATVLLPDARYAAPVSRIAFYDRLAEQLRASSTVEAVGLTTKLPLDPGNTMGYAIVGRPDPAPGQTPVASYRIVNTDYFHALGIPILRGRTFGAGDDATNPDVAVIDRALADQEFPGENPLGQRLATFDDAKPVRVIGVVGGVPIGKLEDPRQPTIYFAYAEWPQFSMRLALRAGGAAAPIAALIRDAVHAADPEAATSTPVSMDDFLEQSPSVFMRRFPLVLLGAFALATLALALVGVYGVVSYSVGQRTREMGIRMALGARPRSLVGLVLRRAAAIALAGIAIGVVASLALGRTIAGLLYGVDARDPATLALAAGVLGCAAVAATLLPARRATRVDPAQALRAE